MRASLQVLEYHIVTFANKSVFIMNLEQIKSLISEDKGNRAVGSFSQTETDETLSVKGVAITANFIDKHNSFFTEDCLRGSLENVIIHNSDHIRDFEHLIANDVKKSLESISLRELGYEADGDGVCFVFQSEFSKEDNPLMYRAYKGGRVKNHSIGFDWRGSREILCINTELEGIEYKENWEKYYPMVINKEVADERGWFYVYEKAPIIEISAVVMGSNVLTPTLSERGYSDEQIRLAVKESLFTRVYK